MVARRSRTDRIDAMDEESLRAALTESVLEIEMLERRVSDLQASGARFLSGAAHAIRNNLTIVQSYLEIIHSDLTAGLSDQQMSFLGIIYDSVIRLRALVDDLADVGALETGIAQFDIKTTVIDSLIEATCHEMRPKAELGGQWLSFEIDGEISPVAADRKRLQEVLRRLVENAIRFTPPNGSIVIRAFSERNTTVIEVKDTGVGIPETGIDEIFDDFTQRHRKPGELRNGYGLGLAIARRLIEAFDGRLTVESTVGEGSTFRICLPAVSEGDSS
jgi:signal transduction histidine kinase